MPTPTDLERLLDEFDEARRAAAQAAEVEAANRSATDAARAQASRDAADIWSRRQQLVLTALTASAETIRARGHEAEVRGGELTVRVAGISAGVLSYRFDDRSAMVVIGEKVGSNRLRKEQVRPSDVGSIMVERRIVLFFGAILQAAAATPSS